MSNTTCSGDMSHVPDDLIHANKAAKLIGAHPSKIHRWVLAGVIPGWKIKGADGMKRRLFVSRADVLGQIRRVPMQRPEDANAARSQRMTERMTTERTLRQYGLHKDQMGR